MSRRSYLILVFVILLAVPTSPAHPFPISFSLSGAIGMGYYAMDVINEEIMIMNQEEVLTMPDLSNGINLAVQGRAWFFDRIAFALSFDHYYAESMAGSGGSTALTFKAPVDLYKIGGVFNAISFPSLMDINLGANICVAEAVFGSNTQYLRLLREYKGNDRGFEIFAEGITTFINPLEIGVQLGYRSVKIDSFEDAHGEAQVLEYSGYTLEVDYSGAFFYITAGIRI